MIPWFEWHTYQIGPLAVQVWGTLVSAGFLLATVIAVRRGVARGLDAHVIWDLAFWMFLAAFVGARVFHVFFYDWSFYLNHPFAAMDPRLPGYSMFGGVFGAICALVLIAWRRGLDLVAYADALAWGVPWGCGVGRIGCFLIHDHPGTLSSFVFAVKYPNGESRHDLGLYLSLVGFATGLLFLYLDRKEHRAGFWVGIMLASMGAARLWLDAYRIADARWFFLTPTQWLSIPLVAIGVWLAFCRRTAKSASGVIQSNKHA